jgi:hypothetical protein
MCLKERWWPWPREKQGWWRSDGWLLGFARLRFQRPDSRGRLSPRDLILGERLL